MFTFLDCSVLRRDSKTCSKTKYGREYGRNYAVANFLVYDFIMATQTESNDISLDAESCLSVPRIRPYFTSPPPHPTRLFSTVVPARMKYHDTFVRPKDLEVFSISGHGPCVSAFAPSAAYTHSLFPSSPAKGGPVGDANPDTVTMFHRNEFR